MNLSFGTWLSVLSITNFEEKNNNNNDNCFLVLNFAIRSNVTRFASALCLENSLGLAAVTSNLSSADCQTSDFERQAIHRTPFDLKTCHSVKFDNIS